MAPPEPFYAHSANACGRWHPLSEHLRSVGTLASGFAQNWPWAQEARLAGLLHDLGKYGNLFQARLRGEESGLDHWTCGADVAARQYSSLAAALAIDGHHTGLQCAARNTFGPKLEQAYRSGTAPLRGLRLTSADTAKLFDCARTDGIALSRPDRRLVGPNGFQAAIATMLDIRMLFSCLVDADFLDTEAHFNGNADGKRPRRRGPELRAERALVRLETYMAESIRGKSSESSDVADVRAKLWSAMAHGADADCGLFTLTAPTGSGKTLAMLRFALAHAQRNGLRRVVLAVPFLSIIEQTARVYRAVFAGESDHFVLEHHSLAGLGDEPAREDAEGSAHEDTERQRRLLSENWDAPVVVTTNVQLLESLFSNRPSACRKLHRLRDAVILFDEAQSLPQNLTVPTLAALSHLSASSHSSVVFATATQPAFDSLHDSVRRHAVSGWQPAELVPARVDLFGGLRRVEVRWPALDEALTWATIAELLRPDESFQSLCVVNLKRHSLALLAAMQGSDGLFHLSTNLCSAHRRAVLRAVHQRLAASTPMACRLVSTQCVEAGVDLDFPVVYRAMAPLEAIAQAAGRCNREGRLNALGRLGQVRVFEPVQDVASRRYMFPTFAYWQAAEVTGNRLRAGGGRIDINDPEAFRLYYHELYGVSRPAEQNEDLSEAITALHFPEIAKRYRLVDQDAIQIVVPWSVRMDEYGALRAQAMRGIDGQWIRRAQTLAVSIYRPKPGHPAWGRLPAAALRRGGVSDEWFVLEDPDRHDPERRLYHDIFGLRLPGDPQVMIA